MTALSKRIAKMPLSKRYVLALLLGIASSLAPPPANFFPVFLAAFPVLIFMLDQCKKPASAFALGWAFGFGYFLFQLYWTPYTLIESPAKWWWAILILLAVLPLVLGFFSGALVGLLYFFCGKKNALQRVVLFSALWALMEWTRGHIFTGFPWSLVGYTWTTSDLALQTTSVIGIYGLSFLSVFLFSLPYIWLINDEKSKKPAFLSAFVICLLVFGFGAWRLQNAQISYHPDVMLRIVQASTSSAAKWSEPEKWSNLQEHIRLSQLPSQKPIRYLIWPEVAITYTDLLTNDPIKKELRRVISNDGYLLSGWMTRANDVNDRDFYNSMIVLNSNAEVVARHDKFHLVPLGEYGLFRKYFKNSRAITVINADTIEGPGPSTLHIDGLPPFSPLICYEIIFPDAVIKRGDRPEWILNITNDNWFGRTAGPHQHFAIARVRAVEEGLPLVRAAISGISAVTDPYGRVLSRLDLKEKNILDTPLPKALSEPSFYSRYGDTLFFLMVLFSLFAGGFAPRKRR